MALTDRQKQISALLDKGKTPKAIGEQLGISENAVYQQRRRIKAAASEGDPATKAATKAATTKTKRAVKSGAKRRPARRRPELSVVGGGTPTPADPLSEVRRRKAEVEAEVSEVKGTLDAAAKALLTAQKAYDEAEAKIKPELERLVAVESLLTGKLKPPRVRKPAQPPAEKAAPAPAPVAEATAEAQDQAAEAPDVPTEVPASVNGGGGEERAGVPTVPEFAQEDPFA